MKLKKNKTRLVLASLLAGTAFIQALPALSCAFAIDPYFSYTNHPDFPLRKYVAGELGILQSGYARSYLLPAYRILSGKPLNADEQKQMVELWDFRITTSDGCANDSSAWLQARKAVSDASKIESIDTERSVSADESWQTYCNCQSSAFSTAADTLKKLEGKFGANSAQVKEWVKAQDQVFSNCGSPSYDDKNKPAVIPAQLPATADLGLRQDRAYQIAAAKFYSQNFEGARTEFDAIAADTASPWSTISSYLATRALIRQATLAKTLNTKLLQQAQGRLHKMTADAKFSSLSVDLTELQNFIAARLEPQQYLDKLSKEPISVYSAGDFTKTIDTLMGDTSDDGGSPESSKMPAALKSPEVVDWIMTFQCADDAAKKHADDRWKQTHSLPWLVAAVSAAGSGDAGVDALIAAADHALSAGDSPAKWTLLYHSNRLNIKKGRADAVRAKLDKILSAPPEDLPPSALNEFKTQRLALSKTLDEFVRFAPESPVCLCEGEQLPDDVTTIEKTGKQQLQAPIFTPEAAEVMDNKLPLSVLKELATKQQLPKDLRAHLAWTTWVRAVLIGDEASAKSLAAIVRPYYPTKQKFLDAYISATTPDTAKFAAAFLLLQFSSAQPNVGFGTLQDPGYGDSAGWWWGSSPIAKYESYEGAPPVSSFDPLFINSAQKAQAATELAKLKLVKTAPNYLTTIAIDWSKSHPTDPRAPEALYWAVKSTRYGATDDTSKILSKQAFNILHTKYKTSTWTKQTPYYY